MKHTQASEAIQGRVCTNPADITNTGPSFKRASLLFVASLGSFIGTSLLLASM